MSKTSARRVRQQQRAAQERSSSHAFYIGVVGLAAILGIAFAMGLRGGDSSRSQMADSEKRSGSAAALDLVADVKTVALGHVPLDRTVTPTWKLTNNGGGTIVLGEPHAEVVEGCCPGPLQLGATTLRAGETTELSFPLQMHAGMDGPHEFSIHVPVERDGDKELLELITTGHFSS